MANKLTPKQKRFAEEYLVDLNATQAALRSGYKDGNIGRILITKNNVARAIQEQMQKRSERTKITQDYVLHGLMEVAERCMQRAPVTTPKGEQAVDEEGNNIWKFDGQTSCRAFELLGKHLGMFTDKIIAEVRSRVVDFGADDSDV